MLLAVKLFAIHGMLVTALQLILSVSFAMREAGAGAIILLLLVLLCSLLVLACQILRNQSVASTINCLDVVVPPLNTELK